MQQVQSIYRVVSRKSTKNGLIVNRAYIYILVVLPHVVAPLLRHRGDVGSPLSVDMVIEHSRCRRMASSIFSGAESSKSSSEMYVDNTCWIHILVTSYCIQLTEKSIYRHCVLVSWVIQVGDSVNMLPRDRIKP